MSRTRAEWRRVWPGGRRPTNARRPASRRVSQHLQAEAHEGSGFLCEAARPRAARPPPRMPRQERGRCASASRRWIAFVCGGSWVLVTPKGRDRPTSCQRRLCTPIRGAASPRPPTVPAYTSCSRLRHAHGRSASAHRPHAIVPSPSAVASLHDRTDQMHEGRAGPSSGSNSVAGFACSGSITT